MSSARSRLRAVVDADRKRIANGERPTYHAIWATANDGSVDVTIRELPLVHLFVPDDAGIVDGARLIIARALGVDPGAFDVQTKGPPLRA